MRPLSKHLQRINAELAGKLATLAIEVQSEALEGMRADAKAEAARCRAQLRAENQEFFRNLENQHPTYEPLQPESR